MKKKLISNEFYCTLHEVTNRFSIIYHLSIRITDFYMKITNADKSTFYMQAVRG